jgi:hypothetical protein
MKIIISENQLTNLFVRRRMNKLHKFVQEQYLGMRPKRNYDEDGYNEDGYDVFFRRVAFGAMTNFLSEELDYDSVDGFIKIRGAAWPFMAELIAKHYGDEIRAYYDGELNN